MLLDTGPMGAAAAEARAGEAVTNPSEAGVLCAVVQTLETIDFPSFQPHPGRAAGAGPAAARRAAGHWHHGRGGARRRGSD